jgi:hypothetical protein
VPWSVAKEAAGRQEKGKTLPLFLEIVAVRDDLGDLLKAVEGGDGGGQSVSVQV